MIKAQNIKKSFGKLQVLKDISLDIQKGEIVSIVGASGAGKTTLLQILGTLLPFESGYIEINKKDITRLNEKQLSEFRNKNIGFVFQFHHLLPEFTAFENICIPGYISKAPRKTTEDKAAELLEFFRLKDRMDHKPSELSGGEQQRVAVARALINNPAVILADEPSGNLDSANKKDLHEMFFSLREKFDQTIFIATHDPQLAEMSDRMLVIEDGVIKGSRDHFGV